MVGCCGRGNDKPQGQGVGFEQKGMIQAGKNLYPGGNNFGLLEGSGGHDEAVCHCTGERRRDLIDQVKIYLSEFDESPCKGGQPQTGPGALKPLGQYPEYIQKHCASWLPSHPRPPLITSIQTHEIRPTEDIRNMEKENTEYVTYVDAKFKPPPESCECVKRNGLQDECPNPYCQPPKPECLANNPGPCCPPSLGLTSEMVKQGVPSPLLTQLEERRKKGCRKNYTGEGPRQGHGELQGDQEGQVKIGIVCVCDATSKQMPPGKKYMCCPVKPVPRS